MKFLDLTVSPAYGRQQAVLRWKADAPEGTAYEVEKSPDGVEWTKIGTTQEQLFLDTNFVVRDRLTDFHYRIRSGSDYSDSVGVFGRATRQQFGAANVILQDWGKKLRNCTPVVIRKQAIFNLKCPVCTDPDTDQRVGASLCKNCFGTGRDGGYECAIPSFMAKNQTPGRTTQSGQNGGAIDTQELKCTMLAYPSLRTGDLLIEPESDDRYLIDAVDTFDAFGKLTVLYTIGISLLNRNDIRYRL